MNLDDRIMPEIKPCPFCGNPEVQLWENPVFRVPDRIMCLGCLAIFAPLGATCEEDLIKAWNRRPENES